LLLHSKTALLSKSLLDETTSPSLLKRRKSFESKKTGLVSPSKADRK